MSEARRGRLTEGDVSVETRSAHRRGVFRYVTSSEGFVSMGLSAPHTSKQSQSFRASSTRHCNEKAAGSGDDEHVVADKRNSAHRGTTGPRGSGRVRP